MKNARTNQDRGVSALGARDAQRTIYAAKQADRRQKAETHDRPGRVWGYVIVEIPDE